MEDGALGDAAEGGERGAIGVSSSDRAATIALASAIFIIMVAVIFVSFLVFGIFLSLSTLLVYHRLAGLSTPF